MGSDAVSEAAESVSGSGCAMIKLMHGDCVSLMRDIPDGSVDMVLCDPPYGIDFQSSRIKDKEWRKPKIANDKKPFVEFIPELKRLLKPTGCVMIFTRWDVQQAFIDEMEAHGLAPNSCIIWDKCAHGMGDLQRSFGSVYESILFHAENDFHFNGKRPTDIIAVPKVPAGKLVHPNEKPVALMQRLINACTPMEGVVLDCFMGSGATGIAAVNTNREFIGIELDDKYFCAAKKRIEQAGMQIKIGDLCTGMV